MSLCAPRARRWRSLAHALLWLAAGSLAAQAASSSQQSSQNQTQPTASQRPQSQSRTKAPAKKKNTPPAPPPKIGDPLPGLTSAEQTRFTAGRDQFLVREEVDEGIGPVFNADSCAACHGSPAVGGGSLIFATRFGTRTGGRFDPLIRLGGPVLQTRGIIGLDNFRFEPEVVPPEATIVAHRRATPTFGYGLVDAVPDAFFHALAAKQELLTPETAGRVNRVTDLRTGKPAVGKFGWKAAVPNLLNFSGDAYKEELGVTTPGWVRDADGRLIDEENPPQGKVELLQFNPVESPNDADIADVRALADFMAFLAPPPRGPINKTVEQGEAVFARIGCADCHAPQLATGMSPTAALSLKTFAPYSDFLLHDMGPLGDGIEQGSATGREMRTAPLWGLRFQKQYLHDGRARSLTEAITRHAGQGSAAAKEFKALKSADRNALLAFLKSL